MNVESSILFYRVLSIVTAILYMNVCLYLGNDILTSSVIAVVVSAIVAFIRYLIRGEINE
jgi:hypothetical protein